MRLALLGGAAMVLGYDARQSTRDVDAVILSPAEEKLVRNLVKKSLLQMIGPKIGYTMELRAIWWASVKGRFYLAHQE